MSRPTIFVTGGTGFLGGAVVAALVAAGYRVRMLARRTMQHAPAGVEVAAGDLSDPRRLARAMQGCASTIHTAGLVSSWVRDRNEFYRTNVEGFRNVVEACREAGVRPLVYTSTFFALGPAAPPGAKEDSGLDGSRRHPYQHSKLLARLEARRLLASGYPIVILYPGVVYGPGRRTEGNVVVKLIADFFAGRVPGLLGGGAQVWSYAYVDDVAAGHLRALEQRPGGGEFVLGGENATLALFFEIVARLGGRRPPRLSIPRRVAQAIGGAELALAHLTGRQPLLTPSTAAMMCESWACDSSRAERDLGYRARPLEDGLRATLEWLRNDGAAPAGARS